MTKELESIMSRLSIARGFKSKKLFMDVPSRAGIRRLDDELQALVLLRYRLGLETVETRDGMEEVLKKTEIKLRKKK